MRFQAAEHLHHMRGVFEKLCQHGAFVTAILADGSGRGNGGDGGTGSGTS